MMKRKNETEPGIKYLQDTGFNRITGKNGIIDNLGKIYDRDDARKIYKKIDECEFGSPEFYRNKNSNLEISMIWNQFFDGDIIRKNCNFVAAHCKYFGETILEVGCESGSMTGFLALTFPDSKIVSIDRCAEALEVAKKRLDALGVNNVEFRCCSLQDIKEQYDTVFCSRVIQENLESDDYGFEGEPIWYQIDWYKRVTDEFTHSIRNVMKEDGTLCVFERINEDPLLYGWLVGLNEAGIGHIPKTFQKVLCNEVEIVSTFHAFICKVGNKGVKEQICDDWYNSLKTSFKKGQPLSGWKALAYLNSHAGTLLKGVYIIDTEGYKVGRFALFADLKKADGLLYLNSVNNIMGTQLLSVGEKEKDIWLAQIQDIVKNHLAMGFTAKVIDPEKDPIEKASL